MFCFIYIGVYNVLLVSLAKLESYSGLNINFCLEVCKSPSVVIYFYVPDVCFFLVVVINLFVCLGFGFLSPKFRNKKPAN